MIYHRERERNNTGLKSKESVFAQDGETVSGGELFRRP